MYDYAMRELGYSTGAAWRRLKAMRLCDEVKGARGRLLEGTLTLDAAAQLQYAFEQQDAQGAPLARPRHREAGRWRARDAGRCRVGHAGHGARRSGGRSAWRVRRRT